MLKNDIIDSKNMWQYHKTRMDKNYRYVWHVSASPSLTSTRPRVSKWEQNNFWLIHASFVMLSHVSTIILHHFYAFFRTNLLTRCPVPVSWFRCFCISENLLLQIFSELDENLRRFFMRNKTPEDHRAALGATHRAGRPPAVAPL